jgi:hypothetical protein
VRAEHPAQGFQKGAFLVSIDLEMAWGKVHRGLGASYGFETERACLYRVLELMEKYGIGGTWAVVGHLFLGRCQKVGNLKHPEIIRPQYPWFSGDWFDADPCSDMESAGTWYAPDVVDRILNCPTSQEIASHSFSHLLVGDPGCSPEAFDSELRECRRLAGEKGVVLRSFVFPRNLVGHLDVLRRNGFCAYRGRGAEPFPNRPPSVRRLLCLADTLVPGPHSVVYPTFREGLWNFPATYFFDLAGRSLTSPLRIRQAIRRLRQAARHRTLFHLWFHPHDLAPDPELAFAALNRLFGEANRLRDAGKLETLTMGELADRLTADRHNAIAT